jgi:DNA-directed RNA polymerase subunit RPC12/RpoP
MARPKKNDARDIVYKVRLNEEEDKILTEASEWTGQAKSEVFRKALLDYYKAVRVNKYISDSDMEASGWDFDHISLQRVITCPYDDCGDDFAVDFSDYSEEQESEGSMGYRCEHVFDTHEIECPSCGRPIHASGVISEYPLGAYEYERISVEKEEEE